MNYILNVINILIYIKGVFIIYGWGGGEIMGGGDLVFVFGGSPEFEE